MSWPIRSQGCSYQVCTGCGIKRLFDEDAFRGYGPYSYDLQRLLAWDHARRLRPGITVHGTGRSAFKDWSCDVAEYPDELSELQLAHNVGDATRRSYRRASAVEKRKAMMTAWADFCGAEFSNVVAMPAKVA